jgi:DNA sulfur modification protein DndD
MRISGIKIQNYRQYKDLEFIFEKTKDSDIHAIIASNGVGKTNLLNAINWCLYGKEPHMDVSDHSISREQDDTEEDKLSLANVESIEECKNNGYPVCEVHVSISMDADTESAVITRSVNVSTESYFIASEDQLEIKVIKSNGEPEFLYGKEAREYVDKYLPEVIREYFFFDGEQLLKYFDVNKKKHIEATINSIAQIGSLNKCEEHLSIIIKDFRKMLNSNDPQLSVKERELEECENNVKAKEKDITDLKRQIEISEQAIVENDAIISGSDQLVRDNDDYNRNLRVLDELRIRKEKILVEIQNLIKQYTILLFLYETNKKTYTYITQHTNSGSDAVDIDIKAIKKTLERMQCIICDEPVDDTLQKHLESLISNYEENAGSSRSILLEIKNDVFRGMEDAKEYKRLKEQLMEELTLVEDEIAVLEDTNATLQERIKKYSENSIEAIQQAAQAKFEHEELLKRNREKLGSYKANLETLKEKETKAHEEFDKAREKNTSNEIINHKLNFADRANLICKTIISEIVTDVQLKMSEETKRLFNMLVWKKETYGHIELQRDYQLKIYHLRTRQSCLKSLSDSEKELLALAFTLALHKVSGYQNLLFIDTPVGRVSDDNRTNFAEVLLEVSKNKQIILAFTPSEYKDEIEAVFTDDKLSTKFKLASNEKETIVRMVK